jgi:hypothetical protein
MKNFVLFHCAQRLPDAALVGILDDCVVRSDQVLPKHRRPLSYGTRTVPCQLGRRQLRADERILRPCLSSRR